MTLIQSLILGLIQGLTEFIPVSSSGHLVLIPEVFGWEQQSTAFDVVVHAGTLLALIIYFRKDLMNMVVKWSSNKRLLTNILISTIPAAVVGLLFSDFIDANFKDINIIVIMLISIGGIMLFIDKIATNNNPGIQQLAIPQALTIGIGQILAFIRGTSRSGITTITGILTGLKLKHAAKYSFLIGIPLMAAAFAKQLLDFGNEGLGDLQIVNLAIGFLASLISGLFAIKFMLKFFEKRGMFVFGAYRILLGLAIWMIFT